MATSNFAENAVGYLIYALIARCLLVYGYRIFVHPLHSYPGLFIAKFTDWYGGYHAFFRRLHLVTYRDHQLYGAAIRQGPNKLVFNTVTALHGKTHPNSASSGSNSTRNYQSDRLYKSRAYLVTQITPTAFNLFNVLDKRLHGVKRRTIGQGINDLAMRKFEPHMMSHINIFVYHLAKSSSDPKAVVDLSEQCKYLGMDVVGELGFGTNLALQTSPKNRFMIKGLETSNFRSNTYMQFPLLKKIGMEVLLYPFILTRQLKYYNTLRDLIVVRRSEGAHARNDLYSFVADIKDPETGEGMRLRDIWSEAAFFMPAGGDTTSTALSAAFFYLSRYPDCYQKLASQIRRTFTNGEEIKSGPKLNSCSYLRACIDETLRLSPPISTTLWRDLPSTDKQPFIIDGHVIPPGTQLGVNIYTIHHNPVYFPDPFVSKSERWLDSSESSDKSSEARKISLEAFTPFSLGSRGCAGKAMAYMELSLAMAKSLWYLDFERPEVGKLDAVGEGKEGDRGGRGRKQEFQLRGQFTTVHEGPNLVFRPRGGEWRELQREVEIGMEGELEEE